MKIALANRPTHVSLLAILSIMPLLMLTGFAVPQTYATENQLIPGFAEFVGTVDVSTLPPASTTDLIQTLGLPSLFPDPAGLAAAKNQLSQPGIQLPGTKTVISPKGSAFIHVQKSIAGTSGANPNPCVCAPPDMGLGASNKHVVQMVNLAGTIFTTSGNVAKGTFSLSDFWGLPARGGPLGIGMSDPEVVFDAGAGRWFASIINTFQVNRIRFAVSQTDSPLGIWYIYSVSTSASNILPDQPYIGYSDDKFIITANDFIVDTTTGTFSAFVGVQYWIFNKAEMLAGSSVGTTRLPNFATNTPDDTKFAIRPAQHLSTTEPSGIAYMVENCQTVTGLFLLSVCPDTLGGGAAVYAISGTPGISPVTVTRTVVEIDQTFFAPNAEQPGTTVLLDTGDNRVQSVVWRQNRLWFALGDACVPTGDTDERSCPRFVQLLTSGISAPTVLQDFDLGLLGAYAFYPAVSTDTAQNLVAVFGTSSTTEFPSLKVSGQLSTMPIETLGPIVTVKAGNAPELSTRYGDYFWAATQPNSPSTFWVSGEHRQVSLFQGWSTQIASINYVSGS